MFDLRLVKFNSKYKCLIAKFSLLNAIYAKSFKDLDDDNEIREYCSMVFEVIYAYINKKDMFNESYLKLLLINKSLSNRIFYILKYLKSKYEAYM